MPPKKPPLKRYIDIDDYRPPEKLAAPPTPAPSHTPTKAGKRRRRMAVSKWTIVATIVAVLLIFMLSVFQASGPTSPVPKSIQKQVSFPVYYPAPGKLPAGYAINTGSFSATNQVVLYTVSNGTQTVKFSIQALPSITALDHFYQTQIPLHETYSEPAGTATVGVINNESIVSLPTHKGAWVIITAALSINQNDLKKIAAAVIVP